MTTTTQASKPARRREFRLSLRVMMLMVLVFGAGLGWEVNQARRMRRGMAEASRLGGRAYFDFQIDSKGGTGSGQDRVTPWYERLLGPEYFHRVDTVEITRNTLSGRRRTRLESLAFLADLGSVRRVIIDVAGVSDSVISGFPRVSGLRILEIQEPLMHDDGLEWISRQEALETLELVGGRLGDTVGDETARRVGRLTSLKRLELYGAGLTDAGVEALSGLRSLNHLRIHGDHLGDRAIRAVAMLPDLQTLTIWDVDGATAGGLASLERLSNLTHLSLYGPSVGHWDMASLAGMRRLTNLTLLDGLLGDRAFAGLPPDLLLTTVTIRFARISDEAVANLGKLESLTRVEFDEDDVSEEAVARLISTRPKLCVVQKGVYRPYPR